MGVVDVAGSRVINLAGFRTQCSISALPSSILSDKHNVLVWLVVENNTNQNSEERSSVQTINDEPCPAFEKDWLHF